MPELPDLHIYAKNLSKLTVNEEVTDVAVAKGARTNAPPEAFAASLKGVVVQAVERQGKEMFFLLSNGNRLAVHLMLFGRFDFFPPKRETNRVKGGWMFCLKFGDNSVLSVSDTSNMCRISLNPQKSTTPDVMDSTFSFDYFMKKAHKHTRTNVKQFLIDQKIMRGIGNAYADEILYKANVSPVSVVGKIPAEIMRGLYDDIRAVLLWAIDSIEIIAPQSINGEERGFLKVHRKDIKVTERGEEIIIKTVAQKKTYYTAAQKPYF